MTVRVLHGDMLAVLPTLPADSIDACVTDPPYEIHMMGAKWDRTGIAFNPEAWRAVYRVLKPGAYLAAFGAPRNSHRMTCAIEDAGFEIRDSIARLHDGGLDGPLLWAFGSGFPKSLDVSKSIDKAAGAVREVVGPRLLPNGKEHHYNIGFGEGEGYESEAVAGRMHTAPATPEAARWAGWGTALKPAFEPIILARKPLIGTVAANVLAHGVGGINVDACRIATDENLNGGRYSDGKDETDGQTYGAGLNKRSSADYAQPAGRWPANVLHDGSDEVMSAFAAYPTHSAGKARSGSAHARQQNWSGNVANVPTSRSTGDMHRFDDADGTNPARFFYSAKATAEDRAGSKHPTVKPLALMNWLVKLITPPGGTVLDPFAGSGTTLLAADRLQLNAIGIEQSQAYVTDIQRRMQSDAPLFAEITA